MQKSGGFSQKFTFQNLAITTHQKPLSFYNFTRKKIHCLSNLNLEVTETLPNTLGYLFTAGVSNAAKNFMFRSPSPHPEDWHPCTYRFHGKLLS
jgi:hypothetical protein